MGKGGSRMGYPLPVEKGFDRAGDEKSDSGLAHERRRNLRHFIFLFTLCALFSSLAILRSLLRIFTKRLPGTQTVSPTHPHSYSEALGRPIAGGVTLDVDITDTITTLLRPTKRLVSLDTTETTAIRRRHPRTRDLFLVSIFSVIFACFCSLNRR